MTPQATPHPDWLSRRCRAAFVVIALGCTVSVLAQDRAPQQPPPAPQEPPPAAAPRAPRAPSPPQPLQKQGLEYFLGAWKFVWSGRESPVTAGPRTGIATFTRIGNSNFMDVRVEGKTDTGAAFKETGIAGWHDGQHMMVFRERLPTGVEVVSVGEWAIPLAIHVDVQPIRIGQSLLQLRRTYNITAVHAFDIVDELSTNGGPFQRLGKGEFLRAEAGTPKP